MKGLIKRPPQSFVHQVLGRAPSFAFLTIFPEDAATAVAAAAAGPHWRTTD